MNHLTTYGERCMKIPMYPLICICTCICPVHGAILCAMLHAMAKLRRVCVSKILARGIGPNIARILYVLSTLLALYLNSSKVN